MKRLGAVAGAVAMLIAAFALRGVIAGDGDDDVAGGETGVLCATELVDLCELAVPGSASAGAGATADRLVAAADPSELGSRVWIVPRSWAELVIAERQRLGHAPLFEVAGAPIASTSTVLAIWADRSAQLEPSCPVVDWACLAARIDVPLTGGDRVRAGIPDVDSASGLSLAAAQAASLLGTSDSAVNDFTGDFEGLADGLAGGQVTDPLLTMRREGPGRLTAAGVLVADATNLSSTFGTIVPQFDQTPRVRVDLVALVPAGGSLDDGRRARLTEAFTDAGWDAPADGPDGLPPGGVLAAIRTLWNDS